MGTFDVDAWREARQAWGVKIDGREYLAREVSAPAVLAAHLELQGASPAQERRILLGLLRLAFPWRPSRIWLGNPLRLINELPPEAWRKVVASFFAFVTGNPVTEMDVLGPSQPTSSSQPSSESPVEASPPTP